MPPTTISVDYPDDVLNDAELNRAECDIADHPSVEFDDDVTDDEMLRAFDNFETQRQARIEKAQFLRDLWQSTNMTLEGLLIHIA